MKLFKNIIVDTIIIFLYGLLAILIETSGSYTTDGLFYIKDPRYMLTIIGIIVCILVMIKNRKIRILIAGLLLYVHMIINIIFIVVFDMTEQWFDLTMLSLRSDAMGILENLPIDFWYTFIWLFIITAYVVFGYKSIDLTNRIVEPVEKKKWHRPAKYSICGSLICIFLILNVLTGYAINYDANIDTYQELLYSNVSSLYNQYGATNNFVNEIYKRKIFYNNKLLTDEEIENYIYNQGVYSGQYSGEYHGISKDNNVICILGETLEWYSFIGANREGYDDGEGVLEVGSGHNIYMKNNTGIKPEKMKELYPNLWRMYENSMVMTNYHAREKTDISESYSIIGSYPVDSFIHRGYAADNVKINSIPSVINEYYNQKGVKHSSQYFHDGYEEFYNRENAMVGFGFDEAYFTEQMKEMGDGEVFIDYGNGDKSHERNLDSQMIDACKDLMFPTDKKFTTYITTITTHGLYQRKRDNLEDCGYYDKLYQASYDEETKKYTLPEVDDASGHELALYTYMAAAMETDKMVGKIFDELESRDLLDETTIVIYGDHQAYYEGLANWLKDLPNNNGKRAIEKGIDFNDLYCVPCMIYDQKLYNKLTDNGANPDNRFNNRFSSSCDIPLTIFDLLGINYQDGLYYGYSMLDNNKEDETLIYSRGYGYFVSEYAYFRNMYNFRYINPIVGDEKKYKDHIAEVGNKLINNIKYMDNFYRTDLFNTESCYNKFKNDLYDINSWDKSKIITYENDPKIDKD